MELSDLESFHFLYRSLWNQNTDERYHYMQSVVHNEVSKFIFCSYYSSSVIRHKINIMDTIIFLQGFPVRWLFTSEKTGVWDCSDSVVSPSHLTLIVSFRFVYVNVSGGSAQKRYVFG